MSTNTRSAFVPKWISVTSWIVRGLLAVLFIYAAGMKLTGQPMMVEEFAHVGLGQGFRYVTGVLELVGAAALLVPRASVIGAALLILVDIGACMAQVFVLHGDWIHTVVIGAMLGGVIFLRRQEQTG